MSFDAEAPLSLTLVIPWGGGGESLVPEPPTGDALLLETGDALLLESGDRILLE